MPEIIESDPVQAPSGQLPPDYFSSGQYDRDIAAAQAAAAARDAENERLRQEAIAAGQTTYTPVVYNPNSPNPIESAGTPVQDMPSPEPTPAQIDRGLIIAAEQQAAQVVPLDRGLVVANQEIINSAVKQNVTLEPWMFVENGKVDIQAALDAGITYEALEKGGVSLQGVNSSDDLNTLKYQLKQEQELSAAIDKVEKFAEPDGSYDLVKLVGLLDKGKFTEADLEKAFGGADVTAAKDTAKALTVLDKYKTGDGYNLVAAKLDGVSDKIIVDAGFKPEDAQEADIFKGKTPSYNEFMSYYGSVYGKGATAELFASLNPNDWVKAAAMMPKEQKNAVYDEYIKRYGLGQWVKGELTEAGDFTANMVVPLYWAKNVATMSPGEIALNIALDALIVVPVVKAGAAAAGKGIAKGTTALVGAISPELQGRMIASERLNEFAEVGIQQTKELGKVLNKAYSPVEVNGKKTTIGAVQNEAIKAKIQYMADLQNLENVKTKLGSPISKEVYDNALKSGNKELVRRANNVNKLGNKVTASEKVYRQKVADMVTALQNVKTKSAIRVGEKPMQVGKKAAMFDSPQVKAELKNLPNEAIRGAKQEVADMYKVARSSKGEIKALEKQLVKAQAKFEALNNNPKRLERGYTASDAAAEVNKIKRQLTIAKAGGLERMQTDLIKMRERLSALNKKTELTKAERLESLKLKRESLALEKDIYKEYQSLIADYDVRPEVSRGGGVATKVKAGKPLSGTGQKTFELTKPLQRGLMLGDARALVAARPGKVLRQGEVAQPSRKQFSKPRTGSNIKVTPQIASTTNTATNTDTGTGTKTNTEAQTKTESKTETETKTQTKTDDRTKTKTKTKTRVIDTTNIKVNRNKLKKPLLLDQGGGGNVFDPKGSIAWKMGEINGKPQWYVVNYPYKTSRDVFRFIGELPEGVENVKSGKDSALKSIQLVTGTPPEKLTIDLGIQDIYITAVNNVPQMIFRADRKQKTKQQITIRKGAIKTNYAPGMVVGRKRK